jgi:hypothetical protein
MPNKDLMKYEKYPIESDTEILLFEFTSIGPNGEVKKIVQYAETEIKGYFNLGFGDKNEYGEINDTIITNNGDSKKVLATVASTVYTFTNHHPDAWIYIQGSSVARTRLYRMGISNNLVELRQHFYIFGYLHKQWEEFSSGKNYFAFLIRRKYY